MPCVPNFDEINDRVRAMRRKEDGPYQCGDYLEKFAYRQMAHQQETSPVLQQNLGNPVNAECRSKMVFWYCQVVEFCNFNREVVELSMRCVDRFLDTLLATPNSHMEALNSRETYELASMTALYIIVKINETEILDPRILSDFSMGDFSEEDIKRTEAAMLTALRWRVNPPTAISFLRHLLALLPTSENVDAGTIRAIYEMATHQVEKSILDYRLVTTRPSVIAYAAILNSIQGIDRQSFPSSDCVPFMKDVALTVGLGDMPRSKITEVRERLLDLLSKSTCIMSKADSESPCQKITKGLLYCRRLATHSPICTLYKKTPYGYSKDT